MPTLSELPPDGLEQWVKLGCTFRRCDMLVRGDWRREDQIDDPDTWDECVAEAMARLGASYAVYELHGQFVLIGGPRNIGMSNTRDYPSREAAQMVAIHGA